MHLIIRHLLVIKIVINEKNHLKQRDLLPMAMRSGCPQICTCLDALSNRESQYSLIFSKLDLMHQTSRHLAAIMFTDIVGYTALMDEDENAAFEMLERNRAIHSEIIRKCQGKFLKEMGDGILASFQTVTDAIYCAGYIQRACEKEEHLDLRIGIHQGEIVNQGDDVFGSGVNIASRIQSIAPVGGIWVSDSVQRNIQNKKGIEVEFVKEEFDSCSSVRQHEQRCRAGLFL